MQNNDLPVVVIGAGPVGLAAAVHLVQRGLSPLVVEAGESVGASVRAWGHVRLFSPWRYVVDGAAARLLEREGWARPPGEELPTGRDLVERYLEPLAATEEIADRIRLRTRAVSVSRLGQDRMRTAGREDAPFVVRIEAAGGEEDLLTRAVVDASGTFGTPNPLGGSGLPALGERSLADRIAYGLPQVTGSARGRYAGRRVLVVGSGHSAFQVLLDLVALQGEEPATEILWAIRRPLEEKLFGGGERDQLPERGRLGQRVRELIDGGKLRLFAGFLLTGLRRAPGGVVASAGARELPEVDEVIATTGFRPDLALTRELRLALDPATESPVQLAPLIDPNVHSCGTVPPHGAVELGHPEPGFYTIGMKSYGRAPTFLLLTGYEQARSVAAALAGDWEAARRVELVLPETGVCSSDPSDGACAVGETALGRGLLKVVSCCGSTSPCCA